MKKKNHLCVVRDADKQGLRMLIDRSAGDTRLSYVERIRLASSIIKNLKVAGWRKMSRGELRLVKEQAAMINDLCQTADIWKEITIYFYNMVRPGIPRLEKEIRLIETKNAIHAQLKTGTDFRRMLKSLVE